MRQQPDSPVRDATVLQLKISLVGISRPPVWRRLLVLAEIRLDQFHDILQAAFGWEGYHMHVFSDGPDEYGLPDPELGHLDERRSVLRDVLSGTGARLRYTYDFGDDWEHDIVVEKVLAADAGGTYPVCLAGKSACPPEDCGGRWGYEHLREVLADPGHAEHEDMLEWLGLDNASEFNPADFDPEEVNAMLGAVA